MKLIMDEAKFIYPRSSRKEGGSLFTEFICFEQQ